MKKIYTVFLMVLFLFILTPVHAKDTQNILITGKHLPYIMVASMQEDDSMDMYVFDLTAFAKPPAVAAIKSIR